MAQTPVSSIEKAGRFKAIDDNFTELYASASATTTTLNATLAPWSSYVATCTSASGSITTKTTTAAFIAIGKTVHFRTSTVISNKGTGGGGLLVDLPATANAAAVAVGQDGFTVCMGLISAASKQMSVFETGFSTVLSTATTVVMSGTYETQ